MTRSVWTRLTIAGFATVLATSSIAQNDLSFADVLQGTSLPTKVKIADLPEDFKAARLTISGDAAGSPLSGLSGLMGMMMPFMTMGRSASNSSATDTQAFEVMQMLDVLWVKPDAVSIEGQKFLITYKLPPMAFMVLDKVKPEQIDLQLSLVRGDMINAFSPLPDLTKAAYAKALIVPATQPSAIGDGPMPPSDVTTGMPAMTDISTKPETAAESNLSQMAKALLLYIQDNNNRVPPVQDTASIITLIQPYIKNVNVTKSVNPNGGRILFNVSLAGRAAASIGAGTAVPVFFDSKPWPNGKRLAVFMDCHLEWMTQAEWKKAQAKFKALK